MEKAIKLRKEIIQKSDLAIKRLNDKTNKNKKLLKLFKKWEKEDEKQIN